MPSTAEAANPQPARPRFSLRATAGWIGSSTVIALLALLLLPAGLLPPQPRRRLARFLTVRMLRLFVAWMSRIGLYRFRFEPAAAAALDSLRHQPRGVLIVANHPTYIDAMVLLARLEQPCVATKQALHRLPALGLVLRRCGWPANDHPLDLHHRLQAELEAGRPVLVFPEGTRSPAGQALGPLRAGAAVLLLAREADAPVLAFRLEVDPRWPGHGASPWHPLGRLHHYRVRLAAAEFTLPAGIKPGVVLPRLQGLLGAAPPTARLEPDS